ncbi:hypothetical protein Droror1_Dr00025540 [Drosera rotundifolia]
MSRGKWGVSVGGGLMRRKRLDDSGDSGGGGQRRLAKTLSALDLLAIGVGSTIGAGAYILVGTVARELTGPALTIGFLIAGIAAALSAFCYAEVACRCPSAGSAYHYSYICVGESVAWLVGWALILEYTIGGAAIARGISPNLGIYFGGEDKVPALLARQTVYGVVLDPCAAVLVLSVTVLLCIGIKESSLAQALVTSMNVSAMVFVVIAGGYLACMTGWRGYHVSSGYFPYGFKGMLAGAATVFFSYIGFDVVAGTAEEVKRPQRDLPLGIGLSLSLCCILYMLMSSIIVGLVPYDELNKDTPISSAFAGYGMEWAVYVVTTGAVMALCASLMGSLLPQPRMLMAMARDGLLPSFFSDIHKHTLVPVKSTVATGVFAAVLAFSMDVSQLAGMVSVGTLLAFTAVAVSVLILRYVPPDEVPLPPSTRGSVPSISSGSKYNVHPATEDDKVPLILSEGDSRYFVEGKHLAGTSTEVLPTLDKEWRRRKVAVWSIWFICIGAFVLASGTSAEYLPNYAQIALCGLGGVELLLGSVILSCIDQDVGRHSFGHTGGFMCPFVPLLPVTCILINAYLLINLGVGAWLCVSIWLLIGAMVYLFYGRSHSCLLDAVYVPRTHVTEILRA